MVIRSGSNLLFGVSLISVDGDKEAWTSETIGIGEQDTLIGSSNVNTFVVGNDNLLDP